MAVDGDTLVAGATHSGLLFAKGAAYVFERQPDGAWLEVQKLLPPSDAWAFGWAVDVDGDRIAVGAKGASDLSGGKGMAYVYEREGGVFVQKATVKPSISVGGDGFGAALDLDGDRLVVGASYNWTLASPNEGLAFVFERQLAGWFWAEKAVLSPDDLANFELFGQAVALDGDRVVVGAPMHSQPSLHVGAAYVFERIAGIWTQTAKLTASDLPYIALFGDAVDIGAGRIVVGAKFDSDLASGAGAAYLFQEGPAGWSEVVKFHGSGIGSGDTFGYELDMEGASVLIGAPNTAGSTPSPGYAFLFDLASDAASLLATSEQISLSQGGVQTLHVGGCSAHAGDLFAVAGSASGTSPGFSFAGIAVPLNPDGYFVHTLNHAGAPPLSGSVGLLDANGFAQASFVVPPGTSPALAGLTLHHAYAVLDGVTLQLEAASPAVPIALVP